MTRISRWFVSVLSALAAVASGGAIAKEGEEPTSRERAPAVSPAAERQIGKEARPNLRIPKAGGKVVPRAPGPKVLQPGAGLGGQPAGMEFADFEQEPPFVEGPSDFDQSPSFSEFSHDATDVKNKIRGNVKKTFEQHQKK